MRPHAADPETICIVGVDPHSSSIDVRDRLAIDEDDLPQLLTRLSAAGVRDCVCVGTCDRLEVIAACTGGDDVAARITTALAAWGEIAVDELRPHLRLLEGRSAVTHLFRLASSLDSVTVGDPHILGQVREAHRVARELGYCASESLDAVLHAACAVARQVRADTGIGDGGVSIAGAACDVSRQVHGDLRRCRVLLLGTGDVGEVIAEALLRGGVRSMTVLDAFPVRAEATALRLGCHWADLDSLAESLPQSDIVVAAVGGHRHVVTRAMVRVAMRRRRQRPMFFCDAALPADVDPDVGGLDGVFVYTLGALEDVAAHSRARRSEGSSLALHLVDEAVTSYFHRRQERNAGPLLASLVAHFEETRRIALQEAGDDADRATRLLVGRLLHAPLAAVRAAARGDDGVTDLQTLRQLLAGLFGMEQGRDDSDP